MEAITSVTGDVLPMVEANKLFKTKMNWTKTIIYVYFYAYVCITFVHIMHIMFELFIHSYNLIKKYIRKYSHLLQICTTHSIHIT